MAILIFNKKIGITTRNLYNHLKKKYRKIGHVGTLDPYAKGIVIVLTEADTKLSNKMVSCDKEYFFSISWGIKSKTYDVQTDDLAISKTQAFPDKFSLHYALMGFLGYYKQKPPLFSSRKYKGKKMYEMSADEQREARDIKYKYVCLKEAKIISHSEIHSSFFVKVSKGFYIRSLAKDIGEKIGVDCVVSMIYRISIGEYNLYSSVEK